MYLLKVGNISPNKRYPFLDGVKLEGEQLWRFFPPRDFRPAEGELLSFFSFLSSRTMK
jgi:hypothetical protein